MIFGWWYNIKPFKHNSHSLNTPIDPHFNVHSPFLWATFSILTLLKQTSSQRATLLTIKIKRHRARHKGPLSERSLRQNSIAKRIPSGRCDRQSREPRKRISTFRACDNNNRLKCAREISRALGCWCWRRDASYLSYVCEWKLVVYVGMNGTAKTYDFQMYSP